MLSNLAGESVHHNPKLHAGGASKVNFVWPENFLFRASGQNREDFDYDNGLEPGNPCQKVILKEMYDQQKAELTANTCNEFSVYL